MIESSFANKNEINLKHLNYLLRPFMNYNVLKTISCISN